MDVKNISQAALNLSLALPLQNDLPHDVFFWIDEASAHICLAPWKNKTERATRVVQDGDLWVNADALPLVINGGATLAGTRYESLIAGSGY